MHSVYKAFIDEINRKSANRVQTVSQIADLLKVEREAVNRRLRGEMVFKFHEAVLIAKYLNISLDEIAKIEVHKSYPFQMKFADFLNPQEDDITMIDGYIGFLKLITDAKKKSEMKTVAMTIPQDIFTKFYAITKLFVFQWKYYRSQQKTNYEDLIMPDIIWQNFRKQNLLSKKISSTSYIFDNLLYKNVVDCILYFKNVHLINEDSIKTLKKELMQSIDYLAKITVDGKFEETGNPVNIHILTDINHLTPISYISTEDHKISMIKSFLLTAVTSHNEEVFQIVKEWVQSVINTSTLIVGANEIQRIAYIERQRDIVNNL